MTMESGNYQNLGAAVVIEEGMMNLKKIDCMLNREYIELIQEKKTLLLKIQMT
jgi:hypothetical protein